MSSSNSSLFNMKDKVGVAIIEVIKKCHRLKKLDLQQNYLAVVIISRLSKAVSQWPGLFEFYLSHVFLVDKECIELVKALEAYVPSLQVMDLSTNMLVEETAPHLASCVASKHMFTKLKLTHNEFMYYGVLRIVRALKNHIHLIEVLAIL
ncbi:hypothetical protein ACS0TY_005246 [Phlomoides rotata]